MASDATPLFPILAREIREGGPIGLDRYMALCLGHPRHGYYATRDPFGAAGDFVTAPEISQMFGELIGAWAATVLAGMAGPRPCLVELGPGRGTLMADALRSLRRAGIAFDLHLVEMSPVLRRLQSDKLAEAAPIFHDSVASLPDAPLLVLANEFFDALPIRQFVRAGRGWHERRVGLSPQKDALTFGLDPEPDPEIGGEAADGAVLTVPSQGLGVIRDVARRIATRGGALLAIDYGYDSSPERPGFGDTLQAVAGHRFVDPLARPGEADLTAHVDFGALARAAAAQGAARHGPVTQRDFLLALGLENRAARLKARATPIQAQAIDAAVARLTDPSPSGMGGLFKVFCASHPALAALPALPSHA